MRLLFMAWGTAALVAAGAPAGAAEPPPKDSDCLECHADKTLTSTNAAGKVKALYVEAAKLKASIHRTNTCASCHNDLTSKHPDDNLAAKPVACARCHQPPSETYGASVHAAARKAGKEGAATCADCHGTHEIVQTTSPQSPLHFSRLMQTCGECHPEALADVRQSVHGKSIAAGHPEAATCIGCHSEHNITKLKGDSRAKVSGDICSKCHASERINTKFRLPSNRVKTFQESYHGLASHYGSARAANCSSCHGVHKILPSTDPQSSIHKTHLVETCGKCHPGANEKFSLAKIHIDYATLDDLGSRINAWVRRIYLVLIVGVVGAMFLHNFLIYTRKALAALRSPARTLVRMSFQQRGQHLVLLVSFILLAITGFALKFPDSWIAWLMGGDEMVRRWIHRGAGVVLLLVGAYHLAYLAAAREGQALVRDLLPRPKDARDAWQNVLYCLGLRRERARMGRFGYVEKAEYWAMIWGTIIMGVTGLMIWFKIDVTRWLPRWAVEVAITIHYYEAILACLAIVVWHFYHVMFDPDIYPLNWAWWDGRVTRHWCEEEHPLDHEALGAPPSAPGPPAGSKSDALQLNPSNRSGPNA